MIQAVWNENMGKALVHVDTNADHFQQEYVAIVTSVIQVLKQSGYDEDNIEHLLVEAINDGFNNLDDIQELRK